MTVGAIRNELGKHYEDFLVHLAGLYARSENGDAEALGKVTKMEQVLTLEARYAVKEIAEGKGSVSEAKTKVKLDPAAFRDTLAKAGFDERTIEAVIAGLREKTGDFKHDIGILDQYRTIYEKSGGKITYEQAAAFLRESAMKSLGKGKAYEMLAQEIIDGTKAIGDNPGFAGLLNMLGERTGDMDYANDRGNAERAKFLEQERALLLKLPSRSLSADAFYAELRKTPGLAEELLKKAEYFSEPDAEDGGYASKANKRVELFAQWLRNKIAADKGYLEGTQAKIAAETVKKESGAGKSGPYVAPGGVERAYEGAQGAAESATAYAFEVQALRSEGKTEEAEALALRVFGNREFDLRNGVTEKELSTATATVAKELAEARTVGDAAETLRSTSPSLIAERVSANLPVGETVRLPIGGRNEEISVTNGGGGKFLVNVGGKDAYECSEKDLGAHLEMAKFLCDNGIAFLAGHSEELLRRATVAQGNRLEADGREFGSDRKRSLLSAVATAFGVDGFPHGEPDIGRMEAYLANYAAERKTSLRSIGMEARILDESGNVRNPEKLYELAKAA